MTHFFVDLPYGCESSVDHNGRLLVSHPVLGTLFEKQGPRLEPSEFYSMEPECLAALFRDAGVDLSCVGGKRVLVTTTDHTDVVLHVEGMRHPTAGWVPAHDIEWADNTLYDTLRRGKVDPLTFKGLDALIVGKWAREVWGCPSS